MFRVELATKIVEFNLNEKLVLRNHPDISVFHSPAKWFNLNEKLLKKIKGLIRLPKGFKKKKKKEEEEEGDEKINLFVPLFLPSEITRASVLTHSAWTTGTFHARSLCAFCNG